VFEKCHVMAVPTGNPAATLDPPEVAKRHVKSGSSGTQRRDTTNIGDLVGMPGYRDSLRLHRRTTGAALGYLILRQAIRRIDVVPSESRVWISNRLEGV
jgi:hypothetical protein